MIPHHFSVGWFDGANIVPTYSPPLDAPCVVCGRPQTTPRVTISLALVSGGERSYFFRAHKACWDDADERERVLIESSIIDRAALASEQAS